MIGNNMWTGTPRQFPIPELNNASASHCSWPGQYNTISNATFNKFIEGKSYENTGSFESALGGDYDPSDYYDWDVPELEGDLF